MENMELPKSKAIGISFLDLLNYPKAVAYFTFAINENPLDAENYDLRSIANYELLNIDLAIADLNKALEIDPSWHLALYHLGEIYFKKNDFEKAEMYFEEALKMDNENNDYSNYLIHTKLNLKKYNDCIVLCNNMVSNYPPNIYALNIRSMVFLHQANYESAIVDLNNLLLNEPKNTSYLNNIGYAYSKIGNFKNAKYFLSECLTADPFFPYAKCNLGYVYYLENDLKEALRLINAAIFKFPSNAYALKNRALVYIKQGDLLNAKSDLLQAEKLGFKEEYGNEVGELLYKIEKGVFN